MNDPIATWTIADGLLEIVRGDITSLHVDAVVNAANSRLAGGGGVDGAIHRAAGAGKLQAACREIISEIGKLSAGQAVATPGFDLKAKTIIHTVGPIWRDGAHDEPQILAAAYANSLKLAADMGHGSIAFPAISCGVYGFPLDQAAGIAVSELKKGLENGLVARAMMVLFDEGAAQAFTRAATTLLGSSNR